MKVKICGITHPEDARMAAEYGADFIGIIFAKRSKRYVEPSQAKIIAEAAFNAGAIPVGVFVEHSAEEILEICEEAVLFTAQLHGETSKKAIDQLQDHLALIYAIQVEKNGAVKEILDLPPYITPLYDCLQGGSGLTFDWNAFTPPSNREWILAGGLTPENVASAIELLQPSMVDVAGGVELFNSTRKDPKLVKAFIQAAKLKEIL